MVLSAPLRSTLDLNIPKTGSTNFWNPPDVIECSARFQQLETSLSATVEEQRLGLGYFSRDGAILDFLVYSFGHVVSVVVTVCLITFILVIDINYCLFSSLPPVLLPLSTYSYILLLSLLVFVFFFLITSLREAVSVLEVRARL